MWFVDVFINGGVMKQPVYPIDTIVGEEQEPMLKWVSLWQMKVGKEDAQWHGSK